MRAIMPLNRLAWLVICALGLAYASVVSAPVLAQGPEDTFTKAFQYRYPVTQIDPSAQNNPPGAIYPGFRGPEQLVVYTPAFGEKTQTRPYGAEAVIRGGVVSAVSDGNQGIPQDGLVLSGHGRGANWIKHFAKPGALIQLEGKNLVVQWTRQSDWADLDVLAQLIQLRLKDPSLDPEQQKQVNASFLSQWHQDQSQAQQCLADLKPEGAQTVPLDKAYHEAVQTCETQWQKVFYDTVSSNAAGFRGVWIRPNETTRQSVEETVLKLKRLGVKDVFLETYYQGKTVFPSQVMEKYGLAVQHPLFLKTDPLQMWVQVAHDHDIRVHAWFQTYMAGNQLANAEKFGPILTKYPQWSNAQLSTVEQNTPVASPQEEGHYFLDPANPEVNQFLAALIKELVMTYPVDGVNLDYIRYPASAGVNSGDYLASNWGYTPVARQHFQDWLKQQAQAKMLAEGAAKAKVLEVKIPTRQWQGKAVSAWDPRYFNLQDPHWKTWVQWRQEQVTHFVKQTSESLRQLKPGLTITAVVFPPADPQLAWKLQDWPTWVSHGYLDALTPIGLNPTPSGVYNHALEIKRLSKGKIPVYVGIFGAYNRLTPLETVQQIDAVQRAGLQGVILFDGMRVTAPYEQALLAGPFREMPEYKQIQESATPVHELGVDDSKMQTP